MDCTSFTLVAGALSLLIFYLINKYSYWKKHGIPVAKGFIPLLGHLLPVITLKCSMSEWIRKMYNDSKNCSMVGFYKLTKPVLMVREPQLTKTILQTNFGSFHQNGWAIDPELDPLLSKNPFFCYGDMWSFGRKRITYAFSSMRLKVLFEALNGVCKKLEDFLERRLKSNNTYEVELKSLFSRFTGEVVANAGFGMEGFCFEDKPHPESFDRIGTSILEPTLLNAIANTIIFFVPSLSKILRISFLPKRVDKWIRRVVSENLELRLKSATPRNDFLQVMINLEKAEGEALDEEVLASDSLSFFLDGFETSSITLSFVVYQLAAHQDVQQRLREEVLSIIAKHDGTLTYDALKEMTYMDQVINESQRIYPAAGVLTKKCTEEFELQGSDGLCCRVEPGTEIHLPLAALQVDPKYWPDPEVFDPDRFDNDRKQNIEKMTFFPFGEGPRMCVGMKIALLQMKACLVTLMRGYKLELSPKMQLPLKLSASHFLAAAVGGLWANISKI
ncbi:cytochrome P450 6j1-like isoform X1 [Colletes gigas]|uniref:cytochrome P450 6j1-like isoform X1 n=1 Tax=Colletes gigas TaxID=935657 RepID=UPI001C9A4C3F|nr:cytochrome P450 6j1-like isoform X1 [Colletes gigas]